ncbi:MarR family transcriptional regulator [Spiractinospora alimapuensis]|uniref:GbsR/MarR family transcriptional regulator n=1 Tax=Spiractinospora alimapuensis TaxID=2820884 RepID=UPI001F1898CC|nr:MarR family transcriptional regulator [Spiractinospora alimapuensis]QVQ50713.1 MarR family transcriptional regulator [Spiractinospora alimapuensis]
MSSDGQESAESATNAADDAVLRAVERFAMMMEEMGLQRMPARIFAFALIDDSDRYTAAEFAEALRVSPAAVSGAVRTLVLMGLLGKEREPGSRSDQYRIYDDDIWRAITMNMLPLLDRAAQGIDESMEALAGHEPGARRLRESQEYFRFMAAEFPSLVDRWHAHRERMFGPDSTTPGS